VAPARPGREGHRGGCRITAARSGRDARWVAGAGGHRQRGAASHQSGSTGAVEPPRPFTWKRPCAPPQLTEGKSAPVRFRGQIGDSQSSTGRGGEQGGGGWWERGGGEGGGGGGGRGGGDCGCRRSMGRPARARPYGKKTRIKPGSRDPTPPVPRNLAPWKLLPASRPFDPQQAHREVPSSATIGPMEHSGKCFRNVP